MGGEGWVKCLGGGLGEWGEEVVGFEGERCKEGGVE